MPFLNHIRNDGLGDDERRVQVYVNNLAELLSAHLVHRNPLNDSGVIDEDIDDPELFTYLRDHVRHLGFVGHVTDITSGINPKLFIFCKRLVKMLFRAAVEGDSGSGACQSAGYGKADAVGRACHKGNLVVEREHTVYFVHFGLLILCWLVHRF